MCFSAQASFLASGLLLPMGAASVAMARNSFHRQALPLAMAPWIFSLQQAFEGVVWQGLDGQALASQPGRPTTTVVAALAYLFLAYAFWPVWMPWCAMRLSPRSAAPPWAWIPRWSPALGLVSGLVLWLPLLSQPRSALPHQVGPSLVYPLHPWSAHLLPPLVGPALYALWMVVPLLLVPSLRVRVFALTLLLAFGVTTWTNHHALTSVWCFLSALLSAQILWILQEPEPWPQP
jgi:hypothetical protein